MRINRDQYTFYEYFHNYTRFFYRKLGEGWGDV